MANVNWNGGKAKGRTQAKAWLRHNDTEKRPQVNHSNADIRPELTHLNAEIGVCANMTYEQKAARLEALLDAYDFKEGAGKNKRVAMQAVCIYPPDGLLEYDEGNDAWKDTPELRAWFEKANAEWEDMVGAENCVGSSIHYDEQHWYVPKGEKEAALSKPHIHADAVPIIDGRISGKAFSARARIIELNTRLEEMTQREFGIEYNTGKGKNPTGDKSVEELKATSERVEKAVFDLEASRSALDAAERRLSEVQAEREQAERERDAARDAARDAKANAKKEAETIKTTAEYMAQKAIEREVGIEWGDYEESGEPYTLNGTLNVAAAKAAEPVRKAREALEAVDEIPPAQADDSLFVGFVREHFPEVYERVSKMVKEYKEKREKKKAVATDKSRRLGEFATLDLDTPSDDLEYE